MARSPDREEDVQMMLTYTAQSGRHHTAREGKCFSTGCTYYGAMHPPSPYLENEEPTALSPLPAPFQSLPGPVTSDGDRDLSTAVHVPSPGHTGRATDLDGLASRELHDAVTQEARVNCGTKSLGGETEAASTINAQDTAIPGLPESSPSVEELMKQNEMLRKMFDMALSRQSSTKTPKTALGGSDPLETPDKALLIAHKLEAIDDRLNSLDTLSDLDRKSRASIIELYNQEFFRVGQDMSTTVKHVEDVRHDVSCLTEKLDGLSAMKLDSEPWTAAFEAEKTTRQALSKLVEERLRDLSDTLLARNAATQAMRLSFETELADLKKDLIAQEIRTANMAGNLSRAVDLNNDDLRALEEEVQSHRDRTFEAHTRLSEDDTAKSSAQVDVSMTRRFAELRVRIDAYDGEVESLTERMGMLEQQTRDNDDRVERRLDTIQYQLADPKSGEIKQLKNDLSYLTQSVGMLRREVKDAGIDGSEKAW